MLTFVRVPAAKGASDTSKQANEKPPGKKPGGFCLAKVATEKGCEC